MLATQVQPVTQRDLEAGAKRLSHLITLLPESVREASSEDIPALAYARIIANSTFEKSSNDADPWPIFNRYLEILFAENTRTAEGRFNYVLRGPFGMDLIMNFISKTVKTGRLPSDIAMIKIQRLIDELEFLTKAPRTSNRTAAQSSQPPSAQTAQTASKRKVGSSSSLGSDDESDKDYSPPKRRRNEPASPSSVLNSGGEEIIQETESGEALRKKREEAAAKKAKSAATSSSSRTRNTKSSKKKQQKAAPASKHGSQEDPLQIDSSGEESDGRSALRNVEKAEQSQGLRRGPRNESLKHFHDAIPITTNKGKKRWEFKCRWCECVRTFERTIDGPSITFDDEPVLPKLNNIATHVNECKNRTSDQPQPEENEGSERLSERLKIRKSAELMEKYLKDGELNPQVVATEAGFLRLFSAWILDEDMEWTAGQAPTLQALFKYLKIKFMLPSDTTVRNQLARIFIELHGKVVRAFTDVKSKIAYSTDTWTTKQMVYTFACTIGSFIDDDWKLIEYVVDFKPLESKEHEGIYAGQAFFEGARRCGGLDKFISLTTDNASVNAVIITTAARLLLSRYNIPYTPDNHVRCIAHVVNLVVQAFLHAIEEAEDPDFDDHYAQNRAAPIHYDIEEDEDVKAMEAEELNTKGGSDEQEADTGVDWEGEAKLLQGKSAVKRLRFVTTKIVSSPQRRQKFRRIAQSKYQDERAKLMVVRDVRTRWNYTHAMIVRALRLKEAINSWIFETPELHGLILSPEDWTRLEQIQDILQPFTQITLEMSRSSSPTIPFVLPTYVQMERHLTKAENNCDYDFTLLAGASAALKKLSTYKALAWKNQFYKLGTMLHPFLRAEWFQMSVDQDAGASTRKDAVTQAEALFYHVAETYSERLVNESAAAPTENSTEKGSGLTSRVSRSGLDLGIYDFPITTAARSSSEPKWKEEVQRYLAFEGGRGGLRDCPLQWWKANSGSFPTLALMARDFLAIPATSVSVERVFSKSRHICTDLRGSLKAETIREALLTKTWIRSGLFDVIKPQQKRPKHGSQGSV